MRIPAAAAPTEPRTVHWTTDERGFGGSAAITAPVAPSASALPPGSAIASADRAAPPRSRTVPHRHVSNRFGTFRVHRGQIHEYCGTGASLIRGTAPLFIGRLARQL